MRTRRAWVALVLLPLAVTTIVAAAARVAVAADFPERAVLDAPAPGKHIGFADSKAAGALPGFGAKDPVVATYYFYWYDAPSGGHFIDADGSDALTDHPADPKGTSYRLPAWHRAQLQDMMAAGIDVALPVYWGCPSDRESWSDVGLPPLVEAADALQAEGAKPPHIGMFYDTSTLQYNAAGHRADLSTADGRAWFYATIRNFFSLVPPRLWATVEGRPLVFLYAAAFAAGGTDDPRLLEYVAEHFARDFGGAKPYIVAEQSWRLAADSTYAWGAAFGLRVLGVASVGPGYDDSAVPGRTTPKADREGGAFYRRQWELLLAMNPARRPHIVTVETWNEFHEGTDVADSREYGRQYIDLTRRYAEAWKAGRRVRPTGSYADAREVTLTFGPAGKAAGVALKTGADGLAEVASVAGAGAIRTLPNPHGPGAYLYFDVADAFFFDAGDPMQVTVEYLDAGGAALDLHYDSTDAAAALAGAYKSAGAIARGQTGTWKTAVWDLKDARFSNRQNLQSDFRLFAPDGALAVRRVSVRKVP
ncbi:MAG: DUF5010 domain-containing protein [Planctomycetes bacterium]|nr:DUF5010 domain-containing protein [Planctomycetota bacterium]